MNTVYDTIEFVWRDKAGVNYLELRDKTFDECFRIAKEFGYTPSVWYKPSTWGNTYHSWVLG